MDGSLTAAPGFGWIMTIVIGAIAGWLAEKITKQDHGLFANIAFGVVGSIIGVFLLRQIGSTGVGGFWYTLLVATGGAVIAVTAWGALRKRG